MSKDFFKFFSAANYAPDSAFQPRYVQAVAFVSYLPTALLIVQPGSVRFEQRRR
jgi:hypothetical protein